MESSTKEWLNRSAWHADQEYDEKENIRLERACAFLRREAERQRLERRYNVLDVGCGVGPLRQWLPEDRFRVVGLDISSEAADFARNRYDECAVGDVEGTWPFEPQSHDAVHAGAIMEHVLDWHAPLNQASRVLEDEGLIVMSVPNLRYWKEIRRLIKGKQPHWISDMKHVHGYTPRFLHELLRIHGFAVEEMEADKVDLPLMPKGRRWGCRRLAGLGSVMILSARLTRRVRVEDGARAHEFPDHKPVSCRAIEIL